MDAVVRVYGNNNNDNNSDTKPREGGVGGGGGIIEADTLKLYIHYQPTYYHFHIHVVHTALEAGATQAVGKAFGLENLIAMIEGMKGGGENEVGMADIELTYGVGEASELWTEVFGPLKEGKLEGGSGAGGGVDGGADGAGEGG